MKYFLKTLLIILLFPTASMAMSERPKADPDCFASDKLRVEIGGEKFAFPRKMVVNVVGPDVVHATDLKDNSASGKKACQKLGDPVWKLTSLSIDLYPVQCSTKKDCSEKMVFTRLEDFESYSLRLKKWKGLERVYSNTREELLEDCQPPKKPYSLWHEKVWSICKFVFDNKKQTYIIKFRGGVYSPEKIEHTKKLVLKKIYKYRIEPNNHEGE